MNSIERFKELEKLETKLESELEYITKQYESSIAIVKENPPTDNELIGLFNEIISSDITTDRLNEIMEILTTKEKNNLELIERYKKHIDDLNKNV